MILHIAGIDKFIPPFIEFIGQNFDLAQHRFWLNGDRNRYPYQDNPSTYQVKPGVLGKFGGYLRLIVDLNKAEKVILHGLFDPKIVLLLSCMPWLLKKCYWIIWGGDLYSYQLAERNWKWQIREFFRRPVIKRIGNLVTYIEGDVELARQWYGARGHYRECVMYLSNVYHELPVPQEVHDTIHIQIGNSADPSNNHLEILERLLPFRDQDIAIFAPLSYGNQEYAKTVIESGTRMFGEKFHPMTDFMPFDRYLAFLGKIDMAIFNHKRQQAMGNTITLLGLGKKVYLRSDTTQWGLFKKKGIQVFDIECLEICRHKHSRSNRNLVSGYFSIDNFRKQLNDIFHSS